MKHFFILVVCGLLVPVFALLGAEEPMQPFVATTASGESVRGPLHLLKADWTLRLGDKTLTANDIVSIRRANVKLPPMPAETQLILANGDRVPLDDRNPANAPRLDGEKLFFRHPDLDDGKEVSVPLAAVSVLWRTTPDNVVHADQLRRQLANGTRSRDRVLLRNGDVLDGLFNALDAKHVEFEQDRKPIEIKLDKVAAVALSTDGVDRLKPKGVYARLVLKGDVSSNGTRLTLASANSDGTTLEGKTMFGATVRVPLARVVALYLFQGAAVYLSELKPAKFEYTPYLSDGGVTWPLAVDAAVTGSDLRLGGSVYDLGLGMHSRSSATYNLEGKYRRFEALVGLDDDTGRDGSVRIRVLGDGKPLALGKDGEVDAKQGPLAVNLRIEGVKELTLEVDFGKRGDVQGHVNWAEARVVK